MDKVIRVASREVLLMRDYIDDLCDWLRREPGSREEFIKNATTAFYDLRAWGGRIETPEGGTIDIVPGLFDDVHSENSCGEWISEQRRREEALRAPRKTLLSRLRVYDALGRLAMRPIGVTSRREERAFVCTLFRRLTPTTRRRYRDGVCKLRSNAQVRDLHYGAAVRRLLIDCAAEASQP